MGLGTVKDSAIAVTKTVSNGFANAAKLLKALTKLLPPRGGPRRPERQPVGCGRFRRDASERVRGQQHEYAANDKVAPPNPSSTPAPQLPVAQVQTPQIVTPPVVPPPPPQPQSPSLPAPFSVAPGFGGEEGERARR